MTFYTREWSSLGDQFLRKNEIDSMLWYDYLNLNNCSICYCKYAGPIGKFFCLNLIKFKNYLKLLIFYLSSLGIIQKNSDKLQLNKVEFQEKFVIEIFNSFGKKLSEIPWSSKNDSVLIYFEWSSNDEELYCITKKGDIYVYDIQGCLKNTFNLYVQIKECKFFHQDDKFGFVILNEMNKFLFYSNVNNYKPFKYPDLPKSFPDTNSVFCWSIARFIANCPDLIFSIDNEVYLLSFMRPTYTQLRYTFDLKSTKINQIIVNLETSSVGLYLNTGVLTFVELNDQNLVKTSDFETKSLSKPTNLIWFCNQAICITWKDIVLIVNSKRKWTTYHIDEKEPYFLVDELDGIRMISNKTHEFIEILSTDIVNIFSVGSEQPGKNNFN